MTPYLQIWNFNYSDIGLLFVQFYRDGSFLCISIYKEHKDASKSDTLHFVKMKQSKYKLLSFVSNSPEESSCFMNTLKLPLIKGCIRINNHSFVQGTKQVQQTGAVMSGESVFQEMESNNSFLKFESNVCCYPLLQVRCLLIFIKRKELKDNAIKTTKINRMI